ncbi:MAG: hypothetical protein ABIG61_13490 [Planctomycetota bacterium]
MDWLVFLAETTTSGEAQQKVEVPLEVINFAWNQITSLNWLQAVIFISFGTVYLVYGWRVFKIFVTINFALLGMFVGIGIGSRIGYTVWGGVAGLAVSAAVAVPLMRWAVSVLGAVAGGLLTAAIWYAVGLPNEYIIAGALVGIVAGGMISFIIFKFAVILFTSLQGGILIIAGGLALLYLHPQTSEQVQELALHEKWFLPVLLFIPTIVGMILQNKFVKKSPKWEI